MSVKTGVVYAAFNPFSPLSDLCIAFCHYDTLDATTRWWKGIFTSYLEWLWMCGVTREHEGDESLPSKCSWLADSLYLYNVWEVIIRNFNAELVALTIGVPISCIYLFVVEVTVKQSQLCWFSWVHEGYTSWLWHPMVPQIQDILLANWWCIETHLLTVWSFQASTVRCKFSSLRVLAKRSSTARLFLAFFLFLLHLLHMSTMF